VKTTELSTFLLEISAPPVVYTHNPGRNLPWTQSHDPSPIIIIIIIIIIINQIKLKKSIKIN
jgi:hypothetical protein